MNIIDRREKLRNMLKEMNEKIVAEQLIEMGFCEAPASATHHGNYEGGLFDHSVTMAEILKELTSRLGLVWKRPESPEIISLSHDLCKVDAYIWVHEYEKKIKREDSEGYTTYQAEAGYHYVHNENQILTGHGEKSCIKALQLMGLTDEETMCIRYHMGAFEGQQIFKPYTAAVKKYPNILYVHLADMLASQIKGI